MTGVLEGKRAMVTGAVRLTVPFDTVMCGICVPLMFGSGSRTSLSFSNAASST